MKEPRVGRLEREALKISRMEKSDCFCLSPGEHLIECAETFAQRNQERAIVRLARRYAARKLREAAELFDKCAHVPACNNLKGGH